MEAFKVFATLSLVDLISGPLGRIRGELDTVSGSAASLGQRFGNLAMSMAPVALAAGAVLGTFGKCVATAAGFEDQMAKVGAVSRASKEELAQLTAKARELGASTQFTASEVGQAEQYLAMAGFSVKDNIAALPGVLNLAAATATDLGRAADISSDILGAFGMKAEEMGRVADVLAMTCSTANTNMELLGDTMKYVAPVARVAGLSIEETAAMAGLLGNVGIKGSQAGTTLKAMLNKMAAPAKEAQEVFQKLGITVKDQAGNLRSPVKILGEMAGKLKTMGTAEQMAAMKAVVGEEAVAGFAELINQGGIGTLEEYIKKIEQSGGACDDMARIMNDTLAGDMRGLSSAFESCQITIGNLFIPVLRKAAQGVTGFLRWIDQLAQHPVGKFFLKVAAAISTAIVAVTAFAGVMWGLSSLGGLISRVLVPLKAAIMGVSAPMLIIIGIAGLLYAAFKTNFGGIASTVTDLWNKVGIAVKAIIAVFQNLKGGSAEIRGELATQIKANGLVGFVQTVSRIVARVMDVFSGFKKGLASAFDSVESALFPARLAIAQLMNALGGLFKSFSGDEVSSSRSAWESFGEVLGQIAGGVLTGLAHAISALVTVIEWLAKGIGYAIDYVSRICGWLLKLTGASQSASEAANPDSWSNLGKVLGAALGAIVAIKGAMLAWRGVMLVVTAVTKGWAIAQGILNAIMYANPIGIVIALCVALAAAAGWIIANWDTVREWWNSFWSGVCEYVSGVWNSIKGAIMDAWQSIVDACSAFVDSILSGLQAAWDGLVAGASEAWNSIVSGVTAFGESVLNALLSVWTSVSESASGAWTSLTEGAANAWNAIVAGLADFGSNLLAGISGAWDQVLAFFDGLNLFESGAKLLSTFIDGIMSMVNSVIDTVSSVLSKVREYLPFSDAHTGPLSQLTLSGSRMMTTLAEGVNQGKGALTGSVAGAVGEAGKQLDALPKNVALPGVGLEVAKLPDVSLPQAETPSAAVSIPEAPAVAPEDTVGPKGHNEGKDSKKSGQNITINIQTLNLPDVTDAAGFVKQLQGAFQSEIGALEGA